MCMNVQCKLLGREGYWDGIVTVICVHNSPAMRINTTPSKLEVQYTDDLSYLIFLWRNCVFSVQKGCIGQGEACLRGTGPFSIYVHKHTNCQRKWNLTISSKNRWLIFEFPCDNLKLCKQPEEFPILCQLPFPWFSPWKALHRMRSF
jgi:hypothetical protein